MRSATPKPLHDLCGRPLVAWPIAAAFEAGAERVVVVDGPARRLDGHLPDGVEVAVQEEPRGTGDAVLAAAPLLRDAAGPVVVLPGDAPLITPELIAELVASHARAGAAATLVTMELPEPGSYGRVVRDDDGTIAKIVEAKAEGDATEEELAIREVSTSVFAFEREPLLEALAEVRPDNAQGEYYLPDVVPLLRRAEGRVHADLVEDRTVAIGVNDRAELAGARAIAQARICDRHMRAGVTIVDPGATRIDVGVELGEDTVVEPFCSLRGTTRAGTGCTIGPLSTLVDARLGDGVTVVHSYLHDCEAHDGATVGPFAYLRPGTVLRDRVKVGTFVEVKNSDIGAGTKVPHLSYLGDADVGEDTNLGAGTITANYDGERKHRTTIGNRVRGSVDTSLVAPVTLGDDAWTAAGSVITDDIPPGALGVARSRQRNVKDFGRRRGASGGKGEPGADDAAPGHDAD